MAAFEATIPPIGFCPRCHYPLNPGTCPECGTEVTAGSILTSLSQTRAAKLRRWAIRLFVFLILPAAAIYGAWKIPWPRLIPSSLLLALQGDARHWATSELGRRYLAGRLESGQTDHLIRNAWRPPVLRIRSPVSAGHFIYYEAIPRIELPWAVSSSMQIELSIKGRRSPETEDGELVARSTLSGLPTQRLPWNNWGPRIDPQTIGNHQIDFEISGKVTESFSCPTNGTTHAFSYKKSLALRVVSARPSELIQEKCTPELQAQSRSRVSLLSSGSGPMKNLSIQSDMNIALVGRVEIAAWKGAEWRTMQQLFFGQGRTRSSPFQVRLDDAAFVRFVPDADVAMALSADTTEILGCILEWRLVPGTSTFQLIDQKRR